MIRQVVFDFGQVLVRFDPDYMTGVYVADAADRQAVAQVVFDRLYWDRLDAGTIEDEEVLAGIRSRLPERLWTAAESVYNNWYRHLPPIPGMEELIARIKRQYGVSVYVLSNISRTFADHAAEFSVFAQAERCIFSAVCGHTKPHLDMFAYLCESCGIRPEETLFVDDSPANIAGAQACGIRGYLFDGDAAALSRYLDRVLRD